jgi:hypothetical protein
MAKKLIRDWKFTPGVAGVSTVKISGRYTLDKLLLITNVADNVILYNFGDAAFAGTTAVFTKVTADMAEDADFPTIWQKDGSGRRASNLL